MDCSFAQSVPCKCLSSVAGVCYHRTFTTLDVRGDTTPITPLFIIFIHFFLPLDASRVDATVTGHKELISSVEVDLC